MDKLELQSSCFNNIKTLCVNYRKDSSVRKTVDYLNKRLSSLEHQWEDFDNRHALLVLELEDKKINYFADDIYGKTKEMYVATKTDITNRITELHEQQQEVQFDLTGTSEDLTTERGDKQQLLLQKQECNFNAIYRTMEKINMMPISEQWELEDHLSTLKSKWDPIDILHWQIDFLLKGSNEEYYKTFSDVEQRYDDLRTKLNSTKWSNAHYKKSAPKIDLPEFSGNYIQWISFKDLFLETIHKNPVINPAQKMQHLKSKLRGEAERLVQHLTLCTENYNTCWDILTQRYDNRRLQFTAYMNTILNLPVIQHPDSFNLKKMHDVITECLNGISNIGIDTASWDPIIVHIMSQKLDTSTLSDYMKELQDHRELQNLRDFLYFLETQFMAYETMKSTKKGNILSADNPSSNKSYKQTPMKNTYYRPVRTNNYFATYGKCPHCKGTHVLMNCDKFIELGASKRNEIITKLQLCKNCLFSHGDQECRSTKTCKECNLKHHTLLHNSERKPITLPNKFRQRPSTSTQAQTSNHLSDSNLEVLLTTVQLKIQAMDGTYIKLRALLDQGSQVNLITENAAQMLRLPRKRINACVTGIGTVSGECRGQLNLICQSIHSDYTFKTQALIMKKLTNNLPNKTFEKTIWPHLENLKLADPEYNISRHIDVILGADIYSDIILDGVLKGYNQSPVAQQTHLGWILCGKMKTVNCHATMINLEELTKFWNIEDIETPQDSPTDDQCEQFYKETVLRSEDGKYIVKMPLCFDFEDKLGSSKSTAISQYLQLEKRLKNNEKLRGMYQEFIKEYADLGHMKPASYVPTKKCYYLPHHGVIRENALTTKLRVVFNASQKTSTGYSLNNLMETGANLQKDILSLILKWRTYKYAFTADIEKMFRCLWLSEDQQHLQRIIWRNSTSGNLQAFQLRTVTYGTKAAPWLAMRTLKQLATDDGHKYPEAARTLITSCYMDDVITGHNDIENAQHLQQSLIQLLRGGGMNLRKWTANHPDLIKNLSEDQISNKRMFDFKNEESSKALGLTWNPSSDTFHFNWPIKHHKRQTKRSLLSNISRFYDPLGWLSPVTIKAKLLFQKLWMSKLAWDDEVPSDIETDWMKLKTDLSIIKNMSLTRWIQYKQQHVELLGFCDASEKAYACVIYSRVFNEHGLPIVTLLAGKTRVAPLTPKTTLPRLELCAAQLLANLMEKTKEAFTGYDVSIKAWSDSQVVLAWIQGDSSRWEQYVANRVTSIKRIIPANEWRYVKSEQNAADCASRGLLPSQLLHFKLWWQGPDFLTKQENMEENLYSYTTNIECINHVATKHNPTQPTDHVITTLLNNYSSLTRITRVVAWIQRFIANMRTKAKSNTAHLTTNELSAATRSIVIHVQRLEFNPEYIQLLQTKTVSRKSSIYKLNPYLDSHGIICVGGRLKNSSLPSDMKHPMIIPHKGRFTQLLIAQAHTITLHGGARLTLTYIRQRYWIISGNRAVKAELIKCIRCHRFKRTDNHQIMGNLPQYRITPCRPFTHTGVDFSGHVDIKLNKGRGVKTSKGYIAIFICMATKAVHIELVSDLSTGTFIAAFQRFCARRGTPKHMYSDCGTNFVGAARVLRQEFEIFKRQLLSSDLLNTLADLEIEWHFNAPGWPSAGGLWEAAVKSMKYHLRRVLGEQKLTYEEFTTLLTKIEACLNSRPLCPLTEDPEEFYNCLTPGHFLTGTPTLSLPLSNCPEVNNVDLRRRWQLLEQMFNQYWKNWSNEYLATLQSRSKWNKPTTNIKQGDIVLVKDNNLPPAKWALGRVMETHPGADGYVRVTTIKTKLGIIKRPVVKLSPLPLNSDAETTGEQNSAPQTTSAKKHRTKSNKCLSTFLITILSMFTFMSVSHCAIDGTRQAPGAQITRLEHERPVYYDEIGRMQLIHDEWILVMYYNLTNYWEGTNRIETYFNHLKNVCDQTKLQLCKTTIEQLEHEIQLLRYYNYVLINPHKHLSIRKKRGLIDGVGYLANSLFGILDQHFAEKYQHDIQSLQNNEDYLFELIKNQTSIVELENDVLKKSEDNIQRQFKLIDKFVNQTNKNLASIESEMEILSATSYINSASFTTFLLINNMRTFQEMLFNTLTNIYQGHLDVHLITPVHLIEQLNEISGSLPKTVSLPVDNYKEHIKDLYKIINVKARVTEAYFLFEAHIPLIANDDFIIYKPIPLPIRMNESTGHVQISSDYVAINLKTNTYISLTKEDFKECLQQKSNIYLCKKNLPAFNLHSNRAPCEAKLLSHHNTAPCDMERTVCKDAWIQLHSSNSWLATCCDICTLRTICNNDVTTYTMTSSSIVSITQGCVMQSKDLTIYTPHQYNSHLKMDYELSVPTLDSSINKIVNLTYTYVPNQFQDTAERVEMKNIEDKVKTQQENENRQLTTISSHDVHQYAISYLMLASAAIALLVVFGRKRCRRISTKQPSASNNEEHQDIELQIIHRPSDNRLNESATTASPSEEYPEQHQPGKSRRSSRTGTRNVAFNFD